MDNLDCYLNKDFNFVENEFIFYEMNKNAFLIVSNVFQ